MNVGSRGGEEGRRGEEEGRGCLSRQGLGQGLGTWLVQGSRESSDSQGPGVPERLG